METTFSDEPITFWEIVHILLQLAIIIYLLISYFSSNKIFKENERLLKELKDEDKKRLK